MGVRRGKRGQFFILAAVILSTLVVSLVSVGNYVSVSSEPEKFYDLSEQIKEESARVIDYGVFTGEDVEAKLDNFSKIVAENIKYQDPDLNFVFVYGNSSKLTIKNYGVDDASFDNTITNGAYEDVRSKIVLDIGGFRIGQEVRGNLGDHSNSWKASRNPLDDESVVVKVNDQEYNFPLGKRQQFLLILSKNKGDERYVEVR
jgi:hypothetical protein